MKVIKHYEEEYELEETADGMPLEPKCPGCGFGCLRQKCAWELGGGCSRHEIAAVFKEEKLRWAAEHTPEGCTCHNVWKVRDVWPAEHSPLLTVGPACPLRI
jgi:hypothetical protein